MAWHRLEHVRSRVNELERMRNKHNQGRSSMRTNQSQMVPVNSMQQPPINATS